LTAFDTVLYDADGRDNGYQESMLSIPHMLVVFVIVLVVFGPQKLPELARSLGKLMAEFRKASADFRGAFEQEMKDMERQVREVERKKAADAAAKSADEAPVQAATFATPAGVETPATATEASNVWVGGGTSGSEGGSEAASGAEADAFGAAIDARVTEGSADLVVTPVAESVARSSAGLMETAAEGANANGAAAEAESGNANVNGSGSKASGETTSETTAEIKGHVVNIDVPHDQRPV
jgi:sec-independent protein translocase protein TatA